MKLKGNNQGFKVKNCDALVFQSSASRDIADIARSVEVKNFQKHHMDLPSRNLEKIKNPPQKALR